MLKFTANSTISAGTVINKVVLLDGSTEKSTITDIRGSVYNDESGIGEYVKISFEDNNTSSYTANNVKLYNDSTLIASLDTTNSPFSVSKSANKGLKFELSCQFTGASNCALDSISIALPYATPFREGIVRLASSNEKQKTNTVYSAADTDSKLSDLGSNYVPWDISGSTPQTGKISVDQIKVQTAYGTSTNEVTITNSSGSLYINKLVTGDAVTNANAAISGNQGSRIIVNSGKLVTDEFLNSLYADSISSATIADGLLATAYAVNALVNGTNNDFVHKAGAEIITGVKTFNANIEAGDSSHTSVRITGSATYQTYASGTWLDSNDQLPTVKAVKGAVDAKASEITSAYTTADNNLQTQIDGINAGQNLADIVDTKGDLVSHSLTDLKAKGDYKKGTSGDTWAIGDKIQVLHDKTKSDGTYSDETAPAIATVYELVKGTIPSGESAKSHASSTTGYYWHYVGEYGVDAYTKAEADARYAIVSASNTFTGNNTFNGNITVGTGKSITTPSIISGSYSGNGVLSSYTEGSSSAGQWGYSGSSSLIPTVSAVTGYVEDYTEDNYVKLSSATVQQISSCLSVTGNLSDTPALSVSGKLSVVSGNAGMSTIDGGLLVDDITMARDSNVSIISNTTANYGHFQISASATSINYAGIFDGSNVSGWIEFRKGTDPVNNISSSLILKEKTGSNTYTNKTAISISPTYDASTNCNGFSVTGDAVADYSDIPTNPPASPTDGRLVTVDYMQAYTGSMGNYATLSGNNIFTGSNTFNDITVTTNHSITTPTITASTSVSSASYTGDGVQSSTSNWNASSNNSKLPTVEVVNTGITNAISSLNSGDSIGAIGLFMLVATGNAADNVKKEIGSTVSGANLYPVGMSLPNSGQISYLKSGSARTGTWTLLSVAFRRTATEPCLVLAMKTA